MLVYMEILGFLLPVKQMTTGEGGMIISKNSKYIKKLRLKKLLELINFFDRKTWSI